MKILLHTCCAPCMIFPLEQLRRNKHEVEGYFFNPNVHPYTEYLKRREAVEQFSKQSSVMVHYPEYFPSDFFHEIHTKEAHPERCGLCWTFRLKAAARVAKEQGFDAFTTTLLVSPYQDQALLQKIGIALAQTEEISFYYEDFRPGFRVSHQQAKAHGLYCQKYCGCLYSEVERCKKPVKIRKA